MGYTKIFQLVYLLFAVHSSAAIAAQSTCNKLPFNLFLGLSSYPPAKTYCSTKYPVATPICSATVTSTRILTFSTTVNSELPSVTVIQTTGDPITQTTTETITPAPTTSTYTEIVSVTSCTIVRPPRKRDTSNATPKIYVDPERSYPPQITHMPNAERSASSKSKNDPLAKLFDGLKSKAKDCISTLCGCINKTPACTTSTATVVTTSSTTITFTNTVQPTATAQLPNTVVITETFVTRLPPTTITESTTSTTTINPPCPTCPGGIQPLVCNGQSLCSGGGHEGIGCNCVLTAELTAFCKSVSSDAVCNRDLQCTTSRQCGSGFICQMNNCCGYPICARDIRTNCPNGANVKMMFGRAEMAKPGGVRIAAKPRPIYRGLEEMKARGERVNIDPVG